MADLIVQGPRRSQRWRRPLPVREMVTLGRTTPPWSVPWDDRISRQHVQLRWDQEVLHVESLPTVANPVFFQGTAVEQCRVRVGEHFVIGETTFTVADDVALASLAYPEPASEQTFSTEFLRQLPFRHPEGPINLLSRLPERIAAAKNDQELYDQVVRVLIDGIIEAEGVALVVADSDQRVRVLAWDRAQRTQSSITTPLEPSQRLILEAIERGASTMHRWDHDGGTLDELNEWAFCIPFTTPGNSGWGIYVTGHFSPHLKKSDPHGGRPEVDSTAKLQDALKFAEVVTSTLGSFLEVRRLQRRQASLGSFFSPPVVAALGSGDPDLILMPREVDVTVLFCDLRGFSLATERSSDDLLGLLARVSDALGVLTRHILDQGGVVGDFHGDSAMGFWGWPLPQRDGAERACRAALAIGREFQSASRVQGHTLSNFRVGVGIASGRAVAGKIGTRDQVKVTVFGPVVNLASRLESMTKRLHVPMLVDGETAMQIRTTLQEVDTMRLRKLALVRPYGMQSAIEVYELLPSEAEYPVLKTHHIQSYEEALEAFLSGDWNLAWAKLHEVPAADESKDFLTTYIAARNRVPPEGWNGVISLDGK